MLFPFFETTHASSAVLSKLLLCSCHLEEYFCFSGVHNSLPMPTSAESQRLCTEKVG